MGVKNQIKAIALTEFPSSSVTASYQVINTDGLDHSCFSLKITNDSTKEVYISFDGVTDHDWIPIGVIANYNSTPNANSIAWVPQWSKGTKVYVRGLAAGTGGIYLSGLYIGD